MTSPGPNTLKPSVYWRDTIRENRTNVVLINGDIFKISTPKCLEYYTCKTSGTSSRLHSSDVAEIPGYTWEYHWPCTYRPVLKIRTICHAWDLWKLLRSCELLHYYARQTRGIYQVLPYSVDFEAPMGFWNPLNKTILRKCSFIRNKGPINIWNGRKAHK